MIEKQLACSLPL